MKRLVDISLKDLSIKRMLMLLIMLVCGISIVMTSLAFVAKEAYESRTAMREDLESLSEIIAKNTSSALLFDDPKSAQDTLAALSSKSNILAIYLLGTDERVFARYISAEKRTLQLPLNLPAASAANNTNNASRESNRLDADRFSNILRYASIEKSIKHDGQKVGTVLIISDMSAFITQLYWTIAMALLIMASTFTLGCLLSSRLQILVSGPLYELIGLMKTVSDTKDFSLRVVKPGENEIGLLFDGFNEMLGEIEERNHILRQRQSHLQELAHFDTLTHLPNRSLFLDRLKQALLFAERNSTSVAIMFIDLDHFKDINDTLGHRMGDLLLVEVARRIQSMVRESDTLARLGGDEFTYFVQDIGNREHAGIVAKKIHNFFSFPFVLEEKEIFVTASIGVTLYPLDGENMDELLMNADIAMYHAKDGGKNAYQLFSREMNKRASERVSLKFDLRQALDRNEFRLQYQPKVDIDNGRVVGVEALLRWNHPEQGLIPPIRFIPIAEETGLILPLTIFVLRNACRQAKTWQAMGHHGIRVAVNITGYHLKRQELVGMVQGVLKEMDLDPSLLEVELTESSLMLNDDYTVEALAELKKLGVSIAIDDFGTGYSSLSYLHRFPIDTLKIDKSFIWNMTKSDSDKALVNTIIAMAESLNMGVVAEGVENVEQLALLKELGCRVIQGYLFSRPLEAEEIPDLLGGKLPIGG